MIGQEITGMAFASLPRPVPRERLRLNRLGVLLFSSVLRYSFGRMAHRKKGRLKIAKEARRRARLGIGLPPAERTIPNKRDKLPKHRKTLGDLLSER